MYIKRFPLEYNNSLLCSHLPVFALHLHCFKPYRSANNNIFSCHCADFYGCAYCTLSAFCWYSYLLCRMKVGYKQRKWTVQVLLQSQQIPHAQWVYGWHWFTSSEDLKRGIESSWHTHVTDQATMQNTQFNLCVAQKMCGCLLGLSIYNQTQTDCVVLWKCLCGIYVCILCH